jgi:hypothetical protein
MQSGTGFGIMELVGDVGLRPRLCIGNDSNLAPNSTRDSRLSLPAGITVKLRGAILRLHIAPPPHPLVRDPIGPGVL